MATKLQIQVDGVLKVNFNAPPYFVIEYQAKPPSLRDERFASAFQDGESILYKRYNNVREVIHFFIAGNTTDALDDVVAALEQYAQGTLDKLVTVAPIVTLVFQPDGTTIEWSSRILSIEFESSERRLSELEETLASKLSPTFDFYTEVFMQIERRYFWEGPLEELPLTTKSVTNQLGGVTVYNHNDTTHGSYVECTPANGSLPTPVELTMEYLVNDGSRMRAVRVGGVRNGYPQQLSLVHIEAEDYTQLYTGVSVVGPNAIYSGDNQRALQCSLSSGQTTFSAKVKWTLTGQQLQYARGRWFRLIGRFTDAGSNSEAYFGLLLSVTSLQIGPITNMGAGWVDFGTFQLPPYDLGGRLAQDLFLIMYARDTLFTLSFTLDDLYLLPCEEQDGYTLFEPQGYNTVYQGKVISDGPNGLVVGDDTGGATAHYVRYGHWPSVTPGVVQRHYFLFDKDTGGAPIASTIKVTMKYRPRRLRL